jgi:hypothetical protein
VFHSAAVLCGGSTGSLLATLIGATLAEIGPELVVTATLNETACAGGGTSGTDRTRAADARDGLPERTELEPAGLCLLVELAVAFGTGEALDESVPCSGGAWSRSSDAAFGTVMDAAMTTAAPTTPARRTLRMATTTP